MGKNQAHKQQQRARMSAPSTGLEEGEVDKLDATFHSPEWHAARLAALQTTSTITWEEYKKKQKEDARKQNELDEAEEKRMREYRAQLDGERAARLAKGRNHADKRDKLLEKKKSKEKKGKDKERKHRKDPKSKEKKRRHRRDSSESESETSSDTSSDRERRKRKSKKDKESRHRKKRRHSSSSDSTSAEDESGPVRLSSFFGE